MRAIEAEVVEVAVKGEEVEEEEVRVGEEVEKRREEVEEKVGNPIAVVGAEGEVVVGGRGARLEKRPPPVRVS